MIKRDDDDEVNWEQLELSLEGAQVVFETQSIRKETLYYVPF
jgi:hypothetical protein